MHIKLSLLNNSKAAEQLHHLNFAYQQNNNKQQNPSPRIDKTILGDFFVPKNIIFRHSGRHICIQGKAIDFTVNSSI